MQRFGFRIALDAPDMEILMERAQQELRRPRDQASWILRQALRNTDALAATAPDLRRALVELGNAVLEQVEQPSPRVQAALENATAVMLRGGWNGENE